jgi:hypothetical protein
MVCAAGGGRPGGSLSDQTKTVRTKALTVRYIGTALVGLASDPPWNPEHIDRLPTEVRNAVLAMCRTRPQAGHYFAIYSDNSRRINLHFEKFHCDQGATFCTNAGCLHQVYFFTNGRYRLLKSIYGPEND